MKLNDLPAVGFDHIIRLIQAESGFTWRQACEYYARSGRSRLARSAVLATQMGELAACGVSERDALSILTWDEDSNSVPIDGTLGIEGFHPLSTESTIG